MRYYVSNEGNDNNSGIRPGSPWRTIDRVNAATFVAGDTVLFRKGDTFYGRIIAKGQRSQNVRPISYGYYGSGEKPIISRYKNIPISSWIEHAPNIWKVSLTDLTKFTGDQEVTAQGVNVGFLKYNGAMYPNKKWAIADLVADWDFYSDEVQYLYVRMYSIPGAMQAAIGQRCFDLVTNSSTGLRVTGLHFNGCAGHAINGWMQDTKIRGCTMSELGGGHLIGFSVPNTRYGNGIEMWNGSARSEAVGNVIHDVYDVATTMQGNLVTAASGWLDCWFRENTIYRCNQTFEVWATGVDTVTPTEPGSGFHRCGFVDNICIDAGYSPFSNSRPDQDTRGHLLLYTITCPDVDIQVVRNKFYRAATAFIVRAGAVTTLPAGYVLKDNHVFMASGQKIMNTQNFTQEEWPAFAAAIGTGGDTTPVSIPDTDEAVNLPIIIGKLMESASGSASSQSVAERVSNELRSAVSFVEDDLNSLRADSLFTGFETSSVSVAGNNWAKILTLTALDSQGRIDGTFMYHIGGDSSVDRRGVGMVNIQFNPIAGGSYFHMDVIEFLPFKYGLAYTDFKAVIVEDALATGGKVQVEVFFNIGLDTFSKLKVMPTSIMQSASLASHYQFKQTDPLVASLPAGTQVAPSGLVNAVWMGRPTIGSAAPTTTPEYVGQEFVDNVNRKVYKAVGTTSSASWELLN